MKKPIITIVVFVTLVILSDYMFGTICNYLFVNAKPNTTTYRELYQYKELESDVLMMGSSRMQHHYVSSIIEDSTNMSVYNLGKDGAGIYRSYAYLHFISRRKLPKLIIYDPYYYDLYFEYGITPEDDVIKQLKPLKIYAHDPFVRAMIKDISPNEDIKLHSNLYKYNSEFVRLLRDKTTLRRTLEESNGYEPLYRTLDYEPEQTNEILTIDNNKISYIQKLINLCEDNNIKLVFTLSPMYKFNIEKYFIPLMKLCHDNNIEFISFNNTELFNSHREYFQDQNHLNDTGARIYTEMLIKELRNRSII